MDLAMESLSHWDYAAEFSGRVAAALVLGIDPSSLETSTTDQDRVNVVCERMARDYERVLKRLYHEAFKIYPEDPMEVHSNSSYELISVKLKNLHTHWTWSEEEGPFTDWLLNDHASAFQAQNFSRETLADWLDAIQLKSAYQFRQGDAHAQEAPDPGDLPDELFAANLAYRAISNGYGQHDDTPKKRILAYLNQHYPHLSKDAIERISTVANPDKRTGRKKPPQE